MGRSMMRPFNRERKLGYPLRTGYIVLISGVGSGAAKRNKAEKNNTLYFHFMCIRSCFTPAFCLYTS